jgi:hypothetical protein
LHLDSSLMQLIVLLEIHSPLLKNILKTTLPQ